jgi:diadenosine tetraphosphate (Ap4A) HIT family hydrolase
MAGVAAPEVDARALVACAFCTLPASRIVLENEVAVAFGDIYPVTAGHSLVIPRRHVIDYWGLADEERQACHDLLVQLKERIVRADPSVTGFNIGLNAGRSAGQTIFHCHYHFIPRRDGDVADPRGGIRYVIPGKGNYHLGHRPSPG